MKKNINVEFIRIVSIVMVIFIHLLSYIMLNVNATENILYFQAFFKVSIGCFFIVMGYVFNVDKDIGKLWLKNIYRFIIPLVIFSLFYELFYDFLTYKSSFMTCLSNIKIDFDLIKKVFLGNVLYTRAFHFWYLYDILKLYLLYPVFKIICLPKNEKYKKILIVILFFIYIVLPSIINLYEPLFYLSKYFNYNLGYICLYFLIGNLFKDNISKIKLDKIALIGLYILMILFCILCFNKIEAFYNRSWLYVYSFDYPFIFIFFASIFIFIFMMKINLRYNKIIMFLGNKTLIIYYIHLAVLYLFVYNPNIKRMLYSNAIGWSFVIAFLVYLLCVLIAFLFQKCVSFIKHETRDKCLELGSSKSR